MPYRVICSERVTAQLTDLFQKGDQAGTGDLIRETAMAIAERPQADPLGFGEPSNHLQAAKLGVRRGAIAPLLVYYAVREQDQLVFIVGFKLLPGHGV